jgi:hypothetical protein
MRTPEITYLSHCTMYGQTIPAGAVAQITTRPQAKCWRPKRLYVEPALAPSFVICDIAIGARSQFVQCQEIAASQFMHGRGTDLDELGDLFECESVLVTMDFVMTIRNDGNRDLPFRATWKCERDYAAERANGWGGWFDSHGQGQIDRDLRPQIEEWARRRCDTPDAPSAIAKIPEARVVERWERSRSVGWDPHGDE